MIVLVRIDDRLVHGQVVEGWLPALGADAILVVSDQAASDPLQTSLMRLALPEGVALEICSVPAATEAYAAAMRGGGNTVVLVPGPAEALAMVEAGAEIREINVGGLHFAAGRVQLGKAIFLSEEDARSLRSLVERGVRLEGRAVPTDRAADVAEMIEERL
ncbi:MAG: PTS sugar transporter subunit IIB [Elusimicrobiota bacterium]